MKTISLRMLVPIVALIGGAITMKAQSWYTGPIILVNATPNALTHIYIQTFYASGILGDAAEFFNATSLPPGQSYYIAPDALYTGNNEFLPGNDPGNGNYGVALFAYGVVYTNREYGPTLYSVNALPVFPGTPSVSGVLYFYGTQTNSSFTNSQTNIVFDDPSDGAIKVNSDTDCGMPVWEVSSPYTSLWLKDEPLGYQPALGARISFEVAFKQREFVTGWNPNVFSVGPKWNFSWFSHVTMVTNIGTNNAAPYAVVYLPGGGQRAYSSTNAYLDYLTRSRLRGDTTNGFTVLYPDGSKDVYDFIITNANGTVLDNYLTERVNPQGQKTQLIYYGYDPTDPVMELRYVIDGDGRTNFIYYATNNPYSTNLISQVTDPFGRSTFLAYDSLGHLTNIVDVGGITNSLQYDTNISCVTNLTTPYGPTSFAITDTTGINIAPNGRAVQVTGPDGSTELFLYQDNVAGVSNSYPSSAIPSSTPFVNTLDNSDLNLRNSFHWGRLQSASLSTTNIASLTANDFLKARMKHWLLTGLGATGQTLSMEREPSPDSAGTIEGQKTWYDYASKTNTEYEGSQYLPLLEARVLPDGSTWFSRTDRNSIGNVLTNTTTYSAGSTVAYRTNLFTYDTTNGIDLITATDALGVQVASNFFNPYHEVLTNYDALSEATIFVYNNNQQLVSVTWPTALVSTNIYGSDGFIAQHINIGFATNAFTYSNDLVLTHTDPRGLTVTNAWDNLQRLTQTTYPDGTSVNYTYSNLDLVKVVDRMGFSNSFGYNTQRQMVAETNALGFYTFYEYCSCGLLEAVLDAAGHWSYFYYDNEARLINAEYPDGYRVTYNYDLVGRLTNVVDLGGVSVTNWFNNQGLVVTVSNAAGAVRGIAFDINDRPTNFAYGNGVMVTNSYDSLGRMAVRAIVGGGVESFGYTPAGLVLYTNQLGYVTTNGYDAEQRKTAETNADGQVKQYGYNAAGDLISLTDGNGHTTQWGYDLYGRVTNKVDATNTTILKYQYDADSRLTNRWSLGRTNTAYAYDKVGNLTGVTYQASHALTFAYDALNRLTSMSDAVGTTTFSYTPAGQLASENGPWADDLIGYTYANRQRTGLSLQQANAPSLAETYAYDGANRLTSITAPPGVFGYQYVSGTQGLVTQISLPNTSYISNFYDALARLTNTSLFNSTNEAMDYIGYAYNNANQRTEEWRGAATTNTVISTNYANYTYDPIGQITSDLAAELAGSANRMNEQLHYVYDAAGNLAYRTNNTLIENFQVNSVNELTTGTNGGRLTVMGTTSSQATNVTVNGTNALLYGDATFAATNMPLTTAYTAIAKDAYGRINTNTARVSLAINSSFQYDLNGNLTNDGTMSFAYDDENQLTEVWVPNQWASVFTYDGMMRRRIRQEYAWSGGWVQTNIVYYVYDGNVVIQEQNSNSVPTVTYTRGKDLSGTLQGAGGIGGLLARTDNVAQQTAFYHADGNGNVTMLINSYQAVVAKYLYDAFGNTLSLSGPIAYANLYRFSSKETHQNSGSIYYLYRHYDPHLQRWLNRDPAGEAGGINLYKLLGSNPANSVDPLGLWGIDPDSNPGGVNAPPVLTLQLNVGVLPGVLPNPNQPLIPVTRLSASTGFAAPIYTPDSGMPPNEQDILNFFGFGQFAGSQLGYQMYQLNLNAIGASLPLPFVHNFPCPRAAQGTGKHLVYHSVNNAGEVRYIGITSDFEAREAAHLAGNNGSGVSFQISRIPGLDNLSLDDARAVEQTLIDTYGLGKNGGTLLNMRNSISPLTAPEFYLNSQFRGQELLNTAGYRLP
jgi:RHS repeat-associated protein